VKVRASHFIPRYHRQYISLYGLPGDRYQELNRHYKKHLLDRRFFVSDQERDDILESVRVKSGPNQEKLLLAPKNLCVQATKHGLIPHQMLQLNHTSYDHDSPSRMFSQGGALSQEYGIPEATPGREYSPQKDEQDEHTQTGYFWQDNSPIIQVFSNYASRDSSVREEIQEILNEAYERCWKVIYRVFPRKGSDKSEYVDMVGESDNRKKAKRLRPGGEAPRPRKEVRDKDTEVDGCGMQFCF
jgi:hypothetical protein